MTQNVTPLRTDWAFWGSVVRAVIQAAAAAIVATGRYWDPQGEEPQLLVGAATTLGLLLVYEPIRERRRAKKAGYSAHQLDLVRAALARLVAEIQHLAQAQMSAITAHIHVVERRWPWTRADQIKLTRIDRLVFNDSFSPTDIEFGPSKGVIGTCLTSKSTTMVFMTRRSIDADGPEDWELVPDEERIGLTWEDHRQLKNRRYGGLIAEPVKDRRGNVIGVLSVGVERGLEQNLGTRSVAKAMGSAASDLSRALI
ncbi:hypothetical protein GGC64_002145 [Mycobacterium sp. OAS707]|nr:hypothetical protein [Mycobacterium sp. OAS707]